MQMIIMIENNKSNREKFESYKNRVLNAHNGRGNSCTARGVNGVRLVIGCSMCDNKLLPSEFAKEKYRHMRALSELNISVK